MPDSWRPDQRRVNIGAVLVARRVSKGQRQSLTTSSSYHWWLHEIDIDNADPQAFQLLDLVGYPKREENDENRKEVWSLYFFDERIDSAFRLSDSALLTIDRN